MNWIADTGIKWDLAASWIIPDAMRNAQRGWDDIWLEKQMRLYFNKLDRRLLRSRHRRYSQRIPRFITLENSTGVGWHAHGLLATPEHINQDIMIGAVKELWLEHVADYQSRLSPIRLAWCQPVTSGYLWYSTKHSFGSFQANTGSIDSFNTYLPPAPH